MLYWHILPIFNRLRVIRPFHFGWDFPTAGQICGVFGENDPQKVKISKNTCLEGTSLRQTTSFELSCVKIGSRVWAVRVARKEKINKIIKGTRPRYFTTTWGRHCWYDPNQIWQSCWSAGRKQSCQIWNKTIHNCDFSEWLKFTVVALHRLSPLTLLSPAGLPVIGHRESLKYCKY